MIDTNNTIKPGSRSICLLLGSKLERTSHAKFDPFLKVLRRVRDGSPFHYLRGNASELVMKRVDWLAQYAGAQYRPAASLVGEYQFWPDSAATIKMCIDSHDSGNVTSRALLEKADIYVKTNYWKDVNYDARVMPFFNCNPVALPHIRKLVAMRNQQAVYDLCFIVRVWGGKTGMDGVEHCMRLLEAVAKVRAKKFILAELAVGDTDEQARRLRSCGVATTTQRITLSELWDITAKSRLNVFRLGNHQCLSWRMTDLFALGTCVVLDQHPKTQWPVPLVHGQHYFSLGATTSYDEPVAATYQYAAIPSLLEDVLGKAHCYENMRRQTAQYFDYYLHPFQIGRQLYDMALAARCTAEASGHVSVPQSDIAVAHP